jgi:thymidylate kinase
MTDRPGAAAALVAVVGPDGAGKSTLTSLLADRLTTAGRPASRVDRWDIIGDPNYPTASCVSTVREARSCAARMSTTPRLLFLLWASVLALTDRDGGLAGETVLVDGYWMKHAASEIAYGADPDWVAAVAGGLPPADLVVYLRLDPEVAWHRKDGRPLPYECGMDPLCGHDSFVSHQRAVVAVLDQWATRYGWLTVDAELPPDIQADQLMETIADRHELGLADGHGVDHRNTRNRATRS